MHRAGLISVLCEGDINSSVLQDVFMDMNGFMNSSEELVFFPPVGAVLLTTCEQRLRKMFVLALVVLLHHEVLGNTVKLSEPKGPRM